MWLEISKMRALEHMEVDMVIWAPYVDAAYEHVLFTPLETLRGLKRFEVYTSWSEDGNFRRASGGKTWPFKITRGIGVSDWLPMQ